MQSTVSALERMPEVVLFLTVGAGFALGALRLGAFALGTVMGALLVGIFVGQFVDVRVSRELTAAFLLLFLFANGYSVGPQFVRALQRDGLKPLVLSVVVAATAFALTYAAARLLELDAGLAAGLFSGAMTSVNALGAAIDALNGLGLAAEERRALANNIAIANALTYFGGAAGMVIFVSVVAPWLLRIDLRREAQLLEARLGIRREEPNVFSAAQKFGVRAFRVTHPDAIGKRID